MIGDTIVYEEEEFEVVWSGGEGLIGDREVKSTEMWSRSKRAYNKKSAFWLKYLEPRIKVAKLELDMNNDRDYETRTNGESGVEPEDLSVSDQIEVLFEAITQLGEQLREQHEEILERLNNLSLPGVDYEVLQEES